MSHTTPHQDHSYYALDLVQEAVIIADSAHQISYLNSAAEHLCACASYEVQGQPLAQILTLIDGLSHEKNDFAVRAMHRTKPHH